MAWAAGWVYNQNDNPVNPYSQFSEVGTCTRAEARRRCEGRRLSQLAWSASRDTEYIKTKQAQNLKSNLLVATTLKQDMCLVCTEGLKRLQHGTCCVLRATSLPGRLAAPTCSTRLYFSGAEGSPAWEKARDFSQKVSTMGVDGQNKEWGRAAQDCRRRDYCRRP